MRKFYLLLLLVVTTTTNLIAQQQQSVKATTPTTTDTKKSQLVTRPTIMVFPFFKKGQNLRKVVEDDINTRLVMTKVKEIFDQKGYSTVDFLSKIRNLETNELLTTEQTSDLKTQIIQGSNADICVEVEYNYTESETGNAISVSMSAYESATSMTLANKVGLSGKFYSQDIGRLATRATNTISEDFLNTMQAKFTDIVENGRYLSLTIGIKDGSEVLMTSEVGNDGMALSDVLENWISENTKSYHIQGVSDLKIFFDVIRVPRLDAKEKPLTTTKYSFELMKFLNSITLKSNPTTKIKAERIINGNTLLVTIK